MAKFRTTGTCPPPAQGGCGFKIDKVWETNSPEKVQSNVKVRCTNCSALFMATNTPSEAKTPTEHSKVEITQDPFELFIEFTVTTTHHESDPIPSIVKKPTGRVRFVGRNNAKLENWFELPLSTIERLVSAQ